jgi:hypothetical protein
MRSRRPLVLVAHTDPHARVLQANELTRAGYRCLVASDPAAARLLALKFALEMVPTLYSGVVLVSADAPVDHDLPATVTCVPPSKAGGLLEAVGRASWAHQARLIKRASTAAVRPGPASELDGAKPESTGAAACW